MTALYVLEVLVAFVQAYVFTMLTTVYIGARRSRALEGRRRYDRR